MNICLQAYSIFNNHIDVLFNNLFFPDALVDNIIAPFHNFVMVNNSLQQVEGHINLFSKNYIYSIILDITQIVVPPGNLEMEVHINPSDKHICILILKILLISMEDNNHSVLCLQIILHSLFQENYFQGKKVYNFFYLHIFIYRILKANSFDLDKLLVFQMKPIFRIYMNIQHFYQVFIPYLFFFHHALSFTIAYCD